MGLRNKLKKAAMTGAALFGASKLMGAKKKAAANVDSGRGGTSSSAKARAKTTERPSNLTKDMGASRKVGDVKTATPRKNPKSIYVQDDGSIQKGDKIYKDKKAYVNRDKSAKSSSSDTMTRAEKKKAKQDAFNKKVRSINAKNSGAKKGKMMKLYSGGMAVSGKGQGVVLAGKNKKTIIC